MAKTMECPKCGETILASATKCKHCFADLTDMESSSSNKRLIWGLLIFLLVLVVIGIGSMRYVYGNPTLSSVTIDEGTDSIVMIYSRFNKEPTTERIDFSDIQKVEFVTGSSILGGSYWAVYVITQAGDKIEINKSTDDNLKGYAETVAAKTGAPFVPINKVKSGRGFFGPGT